MKFNDLAKFILTVLLMGATIALAAFDPVNDDTDIFLANPSIAAERPNVLIILDNTANWNNAFTNEKNALVQVVNGLTDQFNVGLMLFPETGGSNDSVDGGYVRFHVRQMTLQNKTALATTVNNLDKITDKGNNSTVGLALHEAYLYFAGKTSIASHGKVKTDKDGTTDALLSPLTGHALPAGTSPALYRSPITDGCQRSFIIYISNGPASENAVARANTEAKLATLTGVTPPAVISITPDGQQANWADEMARFMANADVFATSGGVPNSSGVQNAYTYTVEVDPGSQSADLDMTALMKSVASNGKGKYFGVTSSASGTAIVDALNAIFSEVQAVNSVFASTTLPVSVNVRGTNLNQVYIGVFRPDSTKAPRWLGNLKMYNLALNSATGAVFLADAANGPPPAVGNAAENSTTGFVSQNSPSFWTASSSYWGFRDASQNGPGGASDRPDGDLVEKGGAAQQLRLAFPTSQDARNLYTCTTGLVGTTSRTCTTNSSLSNTPFNTLNAAISAAALQLDTRLVSPLTGYQTKPVISLVDRKPAILVNSFGGTAVTSLSNGATTRTITSLITSTPKVITSVTSDVSGAQPINPISVSKSGGTCTITSTPALPSGYVAGATVAFSGISGGSSLNGTSKTIDAGSVNTAAKTFTVTCTGSAAGSGGTASVNAIIPSTTARVTLGAHGFVSGQSVTITGATPTNYNVPNANITVTDSDNFTYTMTTAPGTTGNATGTITAAGNTTTATATTSAAHGFPASTTVNISGASIAAYNGAKTIIAVPSTTTFTYSVGATAIGPNTASPVYAVQGGGTTITVTTAAPHGFTDGGTVIIAGSDIAGYNGSWRIACPDCRFPVPPLPGALPAVPQFTFNTATDNVAPTAAITFVLPANTSTSVTATAATSATVVATIPNHGFTVGLFPVPPVPPALPAAVPPQFVVIEGSAPHAGTWEVLDTSTNQITYSTLTALPAPSGSYTARSATNPRATATVTAHGYGNPGDTKQVLISGAAPAAYNTVDLVNLTTVTVVDADTFTYALPGAPGLNTSSTVTASVKTSTARATAVNHGFTNGSTVTVVGATPTAFNGSFVITLDDPDTPLPVVEVVNPNRFFYTIASAQGEASGTVTAAQASGASGDRDLIIRWVRGEDNFQDENLNSSTADIRASVHGDVLHSRPAVINYSRFYKAGGLTPASATDTKSEDDVFVYYGGNDGIFHAVRGGYAVPTGDTSGLTPGREAWGFVPSEFFGEFKRMRNNSPIISSSFKKPYFMDGPIGILTQDNTVPPNDTLGDIAGAPGNTISDVVNLYISNRRGGRFVYALDVNAPTDPKFLWKISNAGGPVPADNFSELGQTWSQPTVVPNLAGLTPPVLVFGAGYDAAVEDVDPAFIRSIDGNGNVCLDAACAGSTKISRSMGRGIYVVNALTGALIRSASKFAGATKNVADMHYAIPSDVTVIRNESGGFTNRTYVGDTGGNLWRIDFKRDTSAAALLANPNNLSLTTVTKLASVAVQPTAANSFNKSGMRKFQFPPDVVGQGGFDAVLIGSGDREHPFDTTVENRFYMFKDKGNDAGAIIGTTTCDPTITEAPIPDAANACAPAADATVTPAVSGDIPGLSDLTSNCIQDAAACAAAGQVQATVTAKLGTDRGWFIKLLAGEKVIGNAITIAGTTFFNTNQPSATAGGGTCGSNLGVARQYQVATADATATSDLNAVGGLTGSDRSLIHAGGGYLPSPVHVVVMLDGKPVEAVISGVQVSTPAGATLSARLRKYWYKEVDPR